MSLRWGTLHRNSGGCGRRDMESQRQSRGAKRLASLARCRDILSANDGKTNPAWPLPCRPCRNGSLAQAAGLRFPSDHSARTAEPGCAPLQLSATRVRGPPQKGLRRCAANSRWAVGRAERTAGRRLPTQPVRLEVARWWGRRLSAATRRWSRGVVRCRHQCRCRKSALLINAHTKSTATSLPFALPLRA